MHQAWHAPTVAPSAGGGPNRPSSNTGRQDHSGAGGTLRLPGRLGGEHRPEPCSLPLDSCAASCALASRASAELGSCSELGDHKLLHHGCMAWLFVLGPAAGLHPGPPLASNGEANVQCPAPCTSPGCWLGAHVTWGAHGTWDMGWIEHEVGSATCHSCWACWGHRPGTPRPEDGGTGLPGGGDRAAK